MTTIREATTNMLRDQVVTRTPAENEAMASVAATVIAPESTVIAETGKKVQIQRKTDTSVILFTAAAAVASGMPTRKR